MDESVVWAVCLSVVGSIVVAGYMDDDDNIFVYNEMKFIDIVFVGSSSSSARLATSSEPMNMDLPADWLLLDRSIDRFEHMQQPL